MKGITLLFAFIIIMVSCEKPVDYMLEGELPSSPDFTLDAVPGDPNSFVVTSLATGNFSHVWDFEGGSPATSRLVSDTVFYKKKGDYTITLHISAADGNGNAYASKDVSVAEDVQGCQLKFLYEDCAEKCWRLSEVEGSIIVGPDPFSGAWNVSGELPVSQSDDIWCFNEEGDFTYFNNGSSFSACQGYVEDEDYPVPENMTYTYGEEAGFEGFNLISLSDNFWMGVEDSGIEYSIVSVSPETMTLLAPIKTCDGTPSPGWFTFIFVVAE